MDHVGHDHSHDHDHGGGHHHHHEHDHAHAQADEFLEQLLTVGICGAFGIVAIILGYQAITANSGMLKLLLVPQFWPWVFGAGIVLLALSIIRGIALWNAAGHEHGPDCNHDHGPDEEHAHGGVFWRAVVMMFPLVLFFLGLPNTSFSNERIQQLLGPEAELGSFKEVAARDGESMSFNDIADAMRDPNLMEARNGRLAVVKGKLKKMNDREFTLYTEKMTCCMADMVPLKARIIVQSDEQGSSLMSKGLKDSEWLEVKGVLQFVKLPNSEQYLPVIRARLRDIKSTAAE
jgi:hypothetical protein